MWKPAYNLTRSPQPKTSPARRAAMRGYWRKYAERNALSGLTTRGTVPKRRFQERLILADVDALAAALAETFHDLTPRAQAKALDLEMKLAAVRKQLL